MKPTIKVITLRVDDLERSLAFYRDGLGLPTEGITGTEFEDGTVVFFNMNADLILALYPRPALAKGAKVSVSPSSPFPGRLFWIFSRPRWSPLGNRLESCIGRLKNRCDCRRADSLRRARTRADLSGEAIRLGRPLFELLPEPEAAGLLALMLLQESRRGARTPATCRRLTPRRHPASPF